MTPLDYTLIYLAGYLTSILTFKLAGRKYEFKHSLPNAIMWSLLSWIMVALGVIGITADQWDYESYDWVKA